MRNLSDREILQRLAKLVELAKWQRLATPKRPAPHLQCAMGRPCYDCR